MITGTVRYLNVPKLLPPKKTNLNVFILSVWAKDIETMTVPPKRQKGRKKQKKRKISSSKKRTVCSKYIQRYI